MRRCLATRSARSWRTSFPSTSQHARTVRLRRRAPAKRALGWTASLILLVAPLHARDGIKTEALGESELVALADGFEDRRDALLRQQIQRPFPPDDAGDLGAALSALFCKPTTPKPTKRSCILRRKASGKSAPPGTQTAWAKSSGWPADRVTIQKGARSLTLDLVR